MTTRRVVLLRHGETDWNSAGRFQGHEDVPLNAAGHEQAAAAGQWLATLRPIRVLSSDLARARQTAGPIADAAGVMVEVDPRLREVDVGSWAGLDLETVGAMEPDFWPALREGRDFRRSPSGESATDAGKRVALALLDYAEQGGLDDAIVVVGHGLSLRVAALLLMGLDYSHARLFAGLNNGAWLTMQPGEEYWRMLTYNAHVGGAEAW